MDSDQKGRISIVMPKNHGRSMLKALSAMTMSGVPIFGENPYRPNIFKVTKPSPVNSDDIIWRTKLKMAKKLAKRYQNSLK